MKFACNINLRLYMVSRSALLIKGGEKGDYDFRSVKGSPIMTPLRQIKLYATHRFSGRKLKEIGKQYGISESGITQASRRIKTQAGKNVLLIRNLKLIEKKLSSSNV
jgi:hypothetical protein